MNSLVIVFKRKFKHYKSSSFFLLFSNKKRFPKLPGFVGKCCQIFGIFSLLIPKAYLMSLIVGNDNCTLAFGGLYLLEFIIMICFNKIVWGTFGGKHITLINYTLGTCINCKKNDDNNKYRHKNK